MLSGYMDGEIDLVHRLEIERHLERCPECANRLENARTVQTALQSRALYAPATPVLKGKVLAAVREAEAAQRPWRRPLGPSAIGIAAALALIAILWGALAQRAAANREALTTQQVTCSHVRSMQANHLLDVPSADPHAIKSWFNGKLDYAPPIVDLTPQGYPLQGGRLDYLNDRSVAALVYRKNEHVINLFSWPSPEMGGEGDREATRHGYRLYRWTDGGMIFCAVSDLSEPELKRFSETLQTHTPRNVLFEECK